MKLVKVNIIFKIRNIWCKKYLKRIQFRLHKHIFYFCKLFSFLHFNSTIFFYLKKIFFSHPSFFFHFQLLFFFISHLFLHFQILFLLQYFFFTFNFLFSFPTCFYFRFRCINFHLCFTTHYFCFLTCEKTDLGDSWTCKKHEKTGHSTILVFSCLPRLWKLYMVTIFVFPH